MPSKYWIKLYHEILHDPKMMRMPEILFGRCMKFFLLAGDFDRGGEIPSVRDISWQLRIPEEEIESDLIELQKDGITASTDGIWRISKWKERQRAATGAERSAMWRQRQQVTEYMRDGPADVTFGDDRRDVSLRREETDIDKETEEEKPSRF